jgi:hypothetical protein
MVILYDVDCWNGKDYPNHFFSAEGCSIVSIA